MDHLQAQALWICGLEPKGKVVVAKRAGMARNNRDDSGEREFLKPGGARPIKARAL